MIAACLLSCLCVDLLKQERKQRYGETISVHMFLERKKESDNTCSFAGFPVVDEKQACK